MRAIKNWKPMREIAIWLDDYAPNLIVAVIFFGLIGGFFYGIKSLGESLQERRAANQIEQQQEYRNFANANRYSTIHSWVVNDADGYEVRALNHPDGVQMIYEENHWGGVESTRFRPGWNWDPVTEEFVKVD